jgi:hypothetical protein
MMTNSIDRDQWLNVTSESRESQQIVRCIPYKLAFQTSCHLIYVPLRLKKKNVGGGCALPGADMQKPYASKCGQGKIKIDRFRYLLQKSPISKL